MNNLKIVSVFTLKYIETAFPNGRALMHIYRVIPQTFLVCCRVCEDMEYTEENKLKLLNDNEDTTPALIHLVITGRASHHYHNGNIIYDKEGHLLVRTKWCFGLDFFKKMESSD